jgi:8-oxo-dGTP pyrophosphatase MutT (NUDIX family)
LREAAVLVGLVPRVEGWQVLLTRRTDALRHHAGQVSFPGGRIEADDTDAIAAALRESHEEIGLLASQASPVGFLDPLCTITGFRVSPLVAMVDAEFVARPDPGEVAEVFEVPLDYILDPANLATLDITTIGGRPLPGGRPRRVLEFVDRGNPRNRIWGATASILFNLRERIASATTAG